MSSIEIEEGQEYVYRTVSQAKAEDKKASTETIRSKVEALMKEIIIRKQIEKYTSMEVIRWLEEEHNIVITSPQFSKIYKEYPEADKQKIIAVVHLKQSSLTNTFLTNVWSNVMLKARDIIDSCKGVDVASVKKLKDAVEILSKSSTEMLKSVEYAKINEEKIINSGEEVDDINDQIEALKRAKRKSMEQ